MATKIRFGFYDLDELLEAPSNRVHPICKQLKGTRQAQNLNKIQRQFAINF
jgi:hypothetical protein